MSHARIGKVTLKASGTEVRVLHRDLPNDGENWRGTIVQHARSVAEQDGQMIGFVVVGFFADGGYSYGCRLDGAAALGLTMLPAYVAEIIRRDSLGPKVVGENLEYL